MSDYEDDFENYDDEFEPEEEGDDYEVLPKNMSKASTPVVTPPAAPSPPRRPGTGTMTPPPGLPSSAVKPLQVPVFVGLTDSQKVAAMRKLVEARKRMKQVPLQEVVLDDLLVMAPLRPYELFKMARSVYAKARAAACQTNDDAREEECQTVEIAQRAFSCQVPDDRNVSPSGDTSSGTATSSAGAAVTAAGPAAMRITQMEPGTEARLGSFVQWAGPLVLASLGMAPSSKTVAIAPQAKDAGPAASLQGLSRGSVRLSFDALLAGRPVTAVSYGPGSEPQLLVAYGPAGSQLGPEALLKDHSLAAKGMCAVWDLSAPAKPAMVLVSEGAPRCCCWAPPPAAHVVFAGMDEGGLCAWDLEESASRHAQEVGAPLPLRRPSYTTEATPDVDTNAASCVAVAATPTGSSRSSPCQVVALSAWGDVSVYTMVLGAPNDTALSDMDLGVRVGSRVRLIRTAASVPLGRSAMRAFAGKQDSFQLLQTWSLALLPGRGGCQMLVGADGGRVLRGSCVGVAAAPKEFSADVYLPSALGGAADQGPVQPQLSLPTGVTALHVSPFCPQAFLAGHDNGTLVLHSTETSAAALVWLEAAPTRIVAVRWSPARPAVFFALDGLCSLYAFDLMASTSKPVVVQPFIAQAPGMPAPSLATVFDCAQVQPVTGAAAAAAAGKGAAAGGGGPNAFAVGYDDGAVDCHLFGDSYSKASSKELQLLRKLVGLSDTTAKGPAEAKKAPKQQAPKPKPPKPPQEQPQQEQQQQQEE